MPANPLTIITDEVSQDLKVVAAFLREFRLAGLELRSLNGRAFKDLTPDDIASVASLARGEGWKVFGCSTPVFKCDLDDAAAVRAHRDIFKRSLDVARSLNCDLLRVFTFLRRADCGDAAIQRRIAEHLRGLLDFAAGSGVRIGVENEHSCMVATAAELQAVLATLPADRFGAIWDPCNVLYVPGAAAPTATESAQLVPRLFHVHVKDSRRRDHASGNELMAEATPVGDGEIGWRAHLKALRDADYRGLLSLETHWRQQKVDESLLHLPAGHAFSAGGEAASRICMKKLQALIGEL